MVVGISRIELHFPESRSLKDKRQIVRSILQRIQTKFNISIAEIDHHDLWQRASIGMSCVSKTSYQARRILHNIEREIETSTGVVILDEHVSIMPISSES